MNSDSERSRVWVKPPGNHLSDLTSVWPWVNQRATLSARPYRRVVCINHIVGMAHPSAADFGPDWRVRVGHDTNGYYRGKLRPLLHGYRSPNSGRWAPPLTQKLLLDTHFTRATEVRSLEGLYWVSNDLHRVAAAHILGRKKILVTIRPWFLRKDAPESLLQWLRGLLAKTRTAGAKERIARGG
jgi:hypothetical protein